MGLESPGERTWKLHVKNMLRTFSERAEVKNLDLGDKLGSNPSFLTYKLCDVGQVT